ncbi:DUF1127 domain-containing protein [Ensifer soli]|uniref:DUF1127 domain-containing protein n=1 Tax=Ciceribacter sp. sgz301302 TaxID=3342379 RepID=UPI0035B8699B
MKTLLRALLNRRAIGGLGDLTDAQLLDIGLSRADVDGALTSAFFEDPSAHLTRAARSRAQAFYRRSV